jgi:hypothetical protein
MSRILDCGNLDISNISEEIITINQSAWVAADVDEKIYLYSTNNTVFGFMVIKFASPCLATLCDDTTSRGIQFAVSTQEMALRDLENFRDFAINNTSYYSQQMNNALANFGLPPSHASHFNPQWGIQRPIPSFNDKISKNLASQPTKGIDAHNLNDFGFQSVAVRPLGAVIPLRDNFDTYGPWTSNNFWTSTGGISVTSDNSFSPWTFGSIYTLNNAGENIVEFSNRGLVKAETGLVTLVGIPSSEHNLPKLGEKLSGFGPNLTSVNFSLSTKGATTTYEFKTYTPKFGKLTKLFYDRYKELNKARNKQLKLLKDFQSKQNKLYRKIAARRIREKLDSVKPDAFSNSMQRVIIGYMDDWYNLGDGSKSQKTVVGMATLAKTSLETFADENMNKSIMSLDGIFSPVSNYNSALPRVVEPEDPTIINTLPAMPPGFSDFENPKTINSKSYNPITIGDTEGPAKFHDGEAMGHSIDIIGRNSIPKNGLINSFYGLSQDDKEKKYGEGSYNFIALKGPLMLHSWGYDLEGNPVPGDGTTFESNWLQKPKSWPVAPIDLRFDKQRGMWVCPQPFRIVTGTLLSPLLPGQEAFAILEDDFSKRVGVVDKIGRSWKAGTRCYLYFDAYINVYIVLEGHEPEEPDDETNCCDESDVD